jgi:hypothetical protein
MSVLTPQIVAEVMRQRLSLPNGAQAPRFINGIPEALKNTARKVAANPRLRPLMISDKATVTLPIVSGAVDLTTGYTTHRFLLEYFQKGHIYHVDITYPLRKISTHAVGLVQQLSEYYYYYIDGDKLRLQKADPSALKPTGVISFAVPTFPATLAQLPESEEVQSIFYDKLVEWCMEPGNDGAEDGDK